ncbi:unnamed protein product [Medioppia subpectinata]|uniref:Small ribosomal subunit protein mS29 n=1 Tax=Medioppia subpectinata TaxID=1979941 RepID=A0A7R9KJS7_9ACAR|nr:unnamed protein product [Medioppia subpectinata]CAG2104704.1 unnamed protein product [Medioppia subpectinata]
MFHKVLTNCFIHSINCSQRVHFLSKQRLLWSSNAGHNAVNTVISRCLSSTPSAVTSHTVVDTFRTNQSDPRLHSTQHLAMYYTIPADIATKLFVLGGFSGQQQRAFKTFRETTLMVRRPALEVMDYLRRAHYNRPVNRYVLYGPIGSGKTFTANHVLHYGFEEKFVLLYCPNPTDWVQYPEETSQSSYKGQRMDTPIDAAVWLQLFRTHNNHLLDELDLRASKQYVWSQREITEPGDPLKNILEHGISRIKHSSDCMAVILKEIKEQSVSGKYRVLVVVDKANAFYESSKIKYPDRSLVDIDNITIARAFKKLFTNDWTNGAVVATVDKKLVVPYRIHKVSRPFKAKAKSRASDNWGPFTVSHISDLPHDLLTNTGFKHFDPFIPIEVPIYDDKEMESCLNYYNDRKWIQRPIAKTVEGRNEIKFLSAFNPLETYEICCGL